MSPKASAPGVLDCGAAVARDCGAVDAGRFCRAGVIRAAAVAIAAWVTLAAGNAQGLRLEIGQNYQGATIDSSKASPPDVMGAVGPEHVVQLNNGEYRVYDKSNGDLLERANLYRFWDDAGAPSNEYAYDPRVVYDPQSQRWFAASVDCARCAGNSYLFAVSNSSDPTDGWTGFAIPSDSTDSSWADFPTLGVDADGVYMAASHFPPDDEGSPTGISVVVLPKADLLAQTPSIANATRFERFLGYFLSPQLAVDLDGGGLPMPIIATTGITGYAQVTSIEGPVMTPSLSEYGFLGFPFSDRVRPAEQPGDAPDIDTGDDRFNSNFVLQNGSLWGVRAINVDGSDGRAALEWFQIDPDTSIILQTGRIEDEVLDLYYPSIAGNEFDQIVIGFNGSSESQYVSAYAVLGETLDGVTSFGDMLLLKEGVDSYWNAWFGRNRWGDYSTTVVDPSDPHVFWTFQEWADSGGANWATQITQLFVVPEPGTGLLLAIGLAGLATAARRRSLH